MFLQLVRDANSPANTLANAQSLFQYHPLQITALIETAWRNRQAGNAFPFDAWPKALTELDHQRLPEPAQAAKRRCELGPSDLRVSDREHAHLRHLPGRCSCLSAWRAAAGSERGDATFHPQHRIPALRRSGPDDGLERDEPHPQRRICPSHDAVLAGIRARPVACQRNHRYPPLRKVGGRKRQLNPDVGKADG